MNIDSTTAASHHTFEANSFFFLEKKKEIIQYMQQEGKPVQQYAIKTGFNRKKNVNSNFHVAMQQYIYDGFSKCVCV